MDNAIRFSPPRSRARPSTIAAVIAVAASFAMVGCGQQTTPPVAVAVPNAAPAGTVPTQQGPTTPQTGAAPLPQTAPALQTAPLPQTAPVPAPQVVPAPQGAAAPVTQPAVPPVTVAQAGRPVPAAPADFPDTSVPQPAQQAPAAQAPQRTAPARVARPAVASNRVGEVTRIEPIREKPQGTGAGGVLGGVLGAVVGNQFGHGNGRAAMTVIGAAGGAYAGNTVERNVRERIVGYEVSVQLDNGAVRSFRETKAGDLQVGDRVRIDGQRLRRL